MWWLHEDQKWDQKNKKIVTGNETQCLLYNPQVSISACGICHCCWEQQSSCRTAWNWRWWRYFWLSGHNALWVYSWGFCCQQGNATQWGAICLKHPEMSAVKDWILLHDTFMPWHIFHCLQSSNLPTMILWCFPIHHTLLNLQFYLAVWMDLQNGLKVAEIWVAF